VRGKKGRAEEGKGEGSGKEGGEGREREVKGFVRPTSNFFLRAWLGCL